MPSYRTSCVILPLREVQASEDIQAPSAKYEHVPGMQDGQCEDDP
jgi:hypothetical protein